MRFLPKLPRNGVLGSCPIRSIIGSYFVATVAASVSNSRQCCRNSSMETTSRDTGTSGVLYRP